MADAVRLNVNLNNATKDTLTRISEAHGLSLTEVIRRSVGLYGFVVDELGAGRSVRVSDQRTGKEREVVLL